MDRKSPPTKEPELPFAERYSPERLEQLVSGAISGKEFLRLTPAQMLRMAMYGFRQYEQGRYTEAKAAFETLITLDQQETYYRIALGAVHMALEELEEAEAMFSRAILDGSKEVAAFVNRGEVNLRLGRIAQAAKDLKRAVELDPKGKDPLIQRARLLARATLEMLNRSKDKSAPAKPAKPSAPAPSQGKAGSAPAKQPMNKVAKKK